MGITIKVLLAVVVASSITTAAPPRQNFLLEIYPNGTFEIGFRINWITPGFWFRSGPIFVTDGDERYSTEDGSLLLKTFQEYNSNLDPFGQYTAWEYTWVNKQNSILLHTEVMKFYGENPIVLFRSYAGKDWINTAGQPTGISCSFPSLIPLDSSAYSGDRGWMTYSGNMGAKTKFGPLNSVDEVYGSIDGGFPVIFFDKQQLNTLVVSPSNNFMNFNQDTWKSNKNQNVIGFGPIAALNKVPSGTMFEVMLYAGSGIVDTVLEWGGLMRAYTKKDQTYRTKDYSINNLGYWTDNGACYYYYTGDYANYEDAMVAVKEYADKEGIPFKYLQIDSWWYFKGTSNGVKNWTAMPSIFPNGIEAVVKQTGWPIVAHNRYWANNTDYATQNGGKFDFVIEGTLGLPVPGNGFWDFLLSQAKSQWGLMVYEQDWLDYVGSYLPATYKLFDLAKDWLEEMGKGAYDNGLTIQYCMAWPKHYLQSLLIDVVTQIRVSDDYQPGNTQWNIGDTVILAEALGLSAFKDTFHTETSQTKCKFTKPEPYPELETVSACLAGGPIGPGDSIPDMNKTLIMSTCMQDGRLLKATRPAMSHDFTIIQRALSSGDIKGQFWVSYSIVSGHLYYFVLGVNIEDLFTLKLSDLPTPSDVKPPSKYMAFTPTFGESVAATQNISSSFHISSCGEADYQYWSLAPVVNTNLTLLGEVGKVVSLSTTRFSSIAYSDNNDKITVIITGAQSETVYIAAAVGGDSIADVKYYKCVVGSTGTATLVIPEGSCM